MVDLKQQHVYSNYFFNCRKMPHILKAGKRENAGWSGCSAVGRTGEGADQVKDLVFGNRRITISDLIMCWKFHLGHLAALWKTIRTRIWFHHIYALPTGWRAEENWISMYQDPQERLETTFWFIFPNFSIVLKGWRFSDITMIKAESHDTLNNIY